jgi:hypothetical protein
MTGRARAATMMEEDATDATQQQPRSNTKNRRYVLLVPYLIPYFYSLHFSLPESYSLPIPYLFLYYLPYTTAVALLEYKPEDK